MTIYLDLILLENIVMNYIIILATGMICKINVKHFRMFVSSLFGAVYAIVTYVINIDIYTNQLTKIFVSVSMIYIAFNSLNIKILLKE